MLSRAFQRGLRARRASRSLISQRLTKPPSLPLAWHSTTNGSFLRRSTRAFSSSSDRKDPEDAESSLVPPEETKAVVANKVPTYPEVLVLATSRPLYPGALYPLTITDKTVSAALVALKATPYVGVFLRKEEPAIAKVRQQQQSVQSELGSDNSTDGTLMPITPPGVAASDQNPFKINDVNEVHDVGTFAQILKVIKNEGTLVVWLRGHRRIKIGDVANHEHPMRVKVRHIDEPTSMELRQQKQEDQDLIAAYRLELISTMKEISKMNPIFREQLMYLFHMDLSNPFLADCSAHLTTAQPHELQEILESFDLKERMHKSLILMKKELQINKLQQTINKGVEEKVSDNQRKYLLNEQLKLIKRELGLEKDEKESLTSKFRERLKTKTVPPAVSEVIEEEFNKLSALEPASMEFGVTRNYLDWLTILPWGVYTNENFDMPHAETVLNKDHYGLDDVKERILEFIAVGKILGAVPQGKIICLVGPPGVGKTSIGKSIARALNREFYRFSVGGMHDVAEIKGHRRTYVGAMPGKLVQCLKKTQCSNPVILIDEIDKLGRSGHQGDPASALLEVLDPEQNFSFLDHYLDVPIDLSKVLFLCTANVMDTIPGPLADRMDFIRISGYVWKEKLYIVKQYLEPAVRAKTGVTEAELVLHDEAIRDLIRWYCREAGVRNLQKHVEKIFRKVALRRARGNTEPVHVTDKNLAEFVGKPLFSSDRMYPHTPVGVVNGLAWSAMGGATLYIEANVADHYPVKSKKSGGGSLMTTGQLGEVMKESSLIAYTVAKAVLYKKDPTNDFFVKNRIHLHVPEGATPKDGPSAGIAMVTSLLSLATGKTVHPDIAMTGEVTLTGKVLQIGGVKEKTIAARRSLLRTLIFPAGNRKDFEELPDYIREGLTVHFVDNYDLVFDHCFGDRPAPDTASLPSGASPPPPEKPLDH